MTPAEAHLFLNEVRARLEARDPLEALAARAETSEEELRDAYYRLSSEVASFVRRSDLEARDRMLATEVLVGLDAVYQAAIWIRRGTAPQATTPAPTADPSHPPRTPTPRPAPEAAPDPLEPGKKAFKARRYEDAQRVFAEATRQRPNDPEAHYQLARATLACAASLESIDRATVELAFRRSIELSPESFEYLLAFARYWSHLGDTKQAIRFYGRVRQLVPAHVEANHELQRLREGAPPHAVRRSSLSTRIRSWLSTGG